MTILEKYEYTKTHIKPVDGIFPPKPDHYKSFASWIKEGRVPLDITQFEIFSMQNGKQGYGYYAEDCTRPLTEKEQQECFTAKKEKQPSNKKNNLSFKEKKDPAQFLPDACKFEGKYIVCFDTETTGFSPQNGDELLQISIVDNTLSPILNTYLKPHQKTSWPGAMRVNHITPKMVSNAPYPEEVCKKVQEIFDKADYIVGYNVKFDTNFVSHCMGVNIEPSKVVDALDIFKKAYPKKSSHKLGSAVNTYLNEREKAAYESNAHDSLADTIATMQVFLKEIESASKEDVSDLRNAEAKASVFQEVSYEEER